MAKLLIFITKGRNFGIDVSKVSEILPLKQTNDIPSSNKIIRGAVNVRGHMIPLFDFRTMIGDPLLIDERQELVNVLNQREQDHISWLEALFASVRDGTDFRKALNPKECAFGKWFYTYKAPDSSIDRILQQLEEPHNQIHGLAEGVLAKAKNGQKEEAIAMIEHAKLTVLSRLLRLFGDLKTALISDLRNLVLLLQTPSGFTYALGIDGVENIRDPEAEKLNKRENMGSISLIRALWSNDKTSICEISVDELHEVVMAENSTVSLEGIENAIQKS